MVQDAKPVGLDGTPVCFDDERAVSDAGVLLVATLAERLGIEALAQDGVRLRRDRAGAANAGRKVMALLYAIVLGADSIDDCDVLRAGRTGRLLGGWVPAPSTLGTFLRAFTFGHVRQLDWLLGRSVERAWQAGAGPGDDRLVVDVDSFVGEVCGRLKRGASYGYTRLLGITRSSRPARTRVRCCTSGCARGRRTRRRGCCASAKSSPPASTAPAPAARSCCAPTRGFRTRRSSTTSSRSAGSTRSACATSRRSKWRCRRSTRMPGSRLPTPSAARRRSPRPSTATGG